MSAKMRRVSKRRPCLICGRPDWCLVAADESAAICARISDGSVKPCGEAGWLHILRDDPNWRDRPRVRTVSLDASTGRRRDIGQLAADYAAAIQLCELEKHASDLGVSPESLARLRVGRAQEYQGFSYPMHNLREHVCGIRLRKWTGKKFSVRGGREGLFWPIGLGFSGQLLIDEGPTDVAAMLDFGFNAIGRPNASGGAKFLTKLMTAKNVSDVVIVADVDAHGAGQRGAESLAARLLPLVPCVRIVRPPTGIKDVRAWKQAGAIRQDVLAAIDAAPVRTLRIRRRGA